MLDRIIPATSKILTDNADYFRQHSSNAEVLLLINETLSPTERHYLEDSALLNTMGQANLIEDDLEPPSEVVQVLTGENEINDFLINDQKALEVNAIDHQRFYSKQIHDSKVPVLIRVNMIIPISRAPNKTIVPLIDCGAQRCHIREDLIATHDLGKFVRTKEKPYTCVGFNGSTVKIEK